MGRSRGGLTTKIHALVDADGLPILLKLTEGQAHDGSSAQDMLGTLGPATFCWPTAPTIATPCAETLAERGAWANVRPMPNGANIPPLQPLLYRYSAISSSASSTSSNISEASPPDTTNAPTTTSPASNSPQPEFGCALMSR